MRKKYLMEEMRELEHSEAEKVLVHLNPEVNDETSKIVLYDDRVRIYLFSNSKLNTTVQTGYIEIQNVEIIDERVKGEGDCL